MGYIKNLNCPYGDISPSGEYICMGTKETDPCKFPYCDFVIKNPEFFKAIPNSKEVSNNFTPPTLTSKCEESRGVITLCGSTKFKTEFLNMLEILTLAGWVVLLPGYYGHRARFPISDDVKEQLDILHKKKIDMSDAIYVLNIDGYIGESTKSEIQYAQDRGKQVIYYE